MQISIFLYIFVRRALCFLRPKFIKLSNFYNRSKTMDQDLYDEFGNYIGPDQVSDESSQKQPAQNQQQQAPGAKVIPGSNEHRIVLHEDKKYYQSHQQMYPQAQILIEQQDQQDINVGILSKQQQKQHDNHQTLKTSYQTQYLHELLKNQALLRNVCIAGHLSHGKTLLMDMLIQETHMKNWNLQKNYRWLDTRADEQQRQMTIKAMPITLLLPDFKEKSYVFNFIDTPGHPNFIGQFVAGLRVADGVVLVVDAIQGVMLMTQRIIKHIVRQDLDVIVVVNKIDRLIIQMKIPPEDAYLKLKHTLEEINGLFGKYCTQFGLENRYNVSPISNNVIFASAEYSFMFSVQSMIKRYKKKFGGFDQDVFRRVLWGDYYFNSQNRKFTKKPPLGNRKRVFVEFILQPIYKIFSHSVGKDKPDLQGFLSRNLGIALTAESYKMNIKTMIKLIFGRYFESNACLISSMIQHFSKPNIRVKTFINKFYRGPQSTFKEQVQKGSSEGPLLIHTVKMYHQKDYKTFDVLGRIISGTLKKGQKVRVLGQSYEQDDQQDMFIKTVTKINLLQGRYKLEIQQAYAGNIVLLQGIDQAITKTSTIVSAQQSYQDIDIIIPLKFWTQPIIKVAIEPLVPSELPKMIDAIRRVNKSYLLLKTKVQQSGEHVLIGTGQIHLQSILHDIRNLYSDIEVRISDPCVVFCQSVAETSGIPCYADTPNKKNKIKTLASPLEKGIVDQVQKQLLNIADKQQVARFVQTKFDWDELASANIWSFGPEIYGANALINDTIVNGVDQKLLNKIRPSIVQGFKWSTRQGPLCDQPMRNVKFRIIDTEISSNMAECPAGQLIPTSRRAFYSAFLTASPRLMEPVYLTEIQCTTSESIEAVFNVLGKRRGTIQTQVPKPGTPHYIIKATIPCIETLGFETDLRAHTVGQAFCLSMFDHWQVLPGDPLDKKIVLRPLEILQTHELAREFMIKTRRRKGLNEEVSIVKYFDDLNIKQLLKNDISFKDFI